MTHLFGTFGGLLILQLLAFFFLTWATYRIIEYFVEEEWMRWLALLLVASGTLHVFTNYYTYRVNQQCLSMPFLAWSMLCLLRRQWKRSLLHFGFGLIFHPPLGVSTALAVFLTWALLKPRSRWYYPLLLVPVAFALATDGTVFATALEVLNKSFLPQHWPIQAWTVLGIGATLGFIAPDRLMRKFLLAVVAIILGSALVTMLHPVHEIFLIHPFRLTVWLELVFSVLVVSMARQRGVWMLAWLLFFIVHIKLHTGPYLFNSPVFILLMLLIPLIMAQSFFGLRQRYLAATLLLMMFVGFKSINVLKSYRESPPFRERFPLYATVNESTPHSAIILLDEKRIHDGSRFKYFTSRATTFSFRDFPYDKAGVKEWYRRYQDHLAWELKPLTHHCKLARKYNATHILRNGNVRPTSLYCSELG